MDERGHEGQTLINRTITIAGATAIKYIDKGSAHHFQQVVYLTTQLLECLANPLHAFFIQLGC